MADIVLAPDTMVGLAPPSTTVALFSDTNTGREGGGGI